MTNIYTLTRQKRYASSNYVTLAPDQASRKTKLLSQFITQHWGSKSPNLYESLDQEALEDYEAYIDPYIRTDIQDIPPYQPTLGKVETATKTCQSCKSEKPLDQFYPRSESKDGRHSKCRDCMKSEARSRKTKRVDQKPTASSFTAVAG